ncbi:solute carrier organic anion transporter family member 1B3 [Suncus etruscus]|uniref:solute carrier organic anion transporter family member 1B3 n=1 Tax=Suncus etruscus TaxID=109475 RepID=UPI00211083E1|nr:solute carrier organic anion transporter family member 1B3 [Suncus etruscus]
MMDQNQHLTNSPETLSSSERKSKCCDGFKMFLAALSLGYICKALGGVIMKSSTIQIERRFEISSSVVGLIDGSFEMGNLLVIVFVSYFGSKLNRPKIIGIGCFIMGLGSIFTALPHFFMGYYRYSKDFSANPSSNLTSSLPVCLPNQNVLLNRTSTNMVGKGHEKESGSYMWVFVLLGNMLRGIGETPIGPLGISYIDDFAQEGQSSFYLGILNGVAMIGPIFGFLMGSVFSKMYVDIGYVDLSTIRITPKDSRWVGAWWLSFLVSGLLAIISSIPFFFLPKSLHKHNERKTSVSLHQLKPNDEKTQTVDSTNSSRENVTESLAGKVLYNCSCIEEIGFKNKNNSATLGECPRNYQCKKKFYVYIAIQVLSSLVSSLGHIPILMMIFKNVQPELKSLAVGFHSLIIRALGGIPAPIYFGILVDKACLKWSINRHGKQGSCRVYNSEFYGYTFLGLTMILKFSSLFIYFLLISAMKKKYQGEDAKTLENGGKVTNEVNTDSLEKEGHLFPSRRVHKDTVM